MTPTRAWLALACALLSLGPAARAHAQSSEPVETTPEPPASPTPEPVPLAITPAAPEAPEALAEPEAAASVTASATPEAATAAATTAPAAVSTPDAETAPAAEPADEPELDSELSLQPRVHNSWFGPTGGLHVVDAGSGPQHTFRLQLGLDLFTSSDYLVAGDDNDYLGGTLSLSYTPIDHLELFGALANHANSNDRDEPELMQVLGDATLGAKGFYDVEPWAMLGGDLRFVVPSTVGGVGPLMAAISVGLRANASVDLRELDDPAPLIARFSVDYFFDNSSKLIEDVEAERYLALGPDRNPMATESRHLLRRVERFALGINRTDAFSFALGLEAPLRAAPELLLHPILEWSLSLPVNRQGYSCLLANTDADAGDEDGCLAIEGLASMPSTLTLGVRAMPGVDGLSLALGLDIGLSGTSTFVRELAPNRPWALLMALGYAVDPRGRERAVPVEVVREVRVPPPPQVRVQGEVIDGATGAGVANARIDYPDLELTAQQADAVGHFVTYGLEPGALRLEVSHPDYEPAPCVTDVPKPAAAQPASPATPPEAASELTAHNPYLGPSHPAHAQGAEGAQGRSMRCPLVPRPRLGAIKGRVTSEAGEPVSSAMLELTGPTTLKLSSDPLGQFVQLEVPTGAYALRTEAEGYLLRMVNVDIIAGQTVDVPVVLVPKPKQAQVELTAQEVRIRQQVFFKTNSAEISNKSNTLLTEIADVLLRNPQVKLVEIQGHTDNTGNPMINQTLSQARAEAVRTWLVAAGVAPGRLTAKGYGDERPLLPNLTERARARNRRVQMVIRQQP